ncbi:APC family permease [Siminovitchia sp. 179-K 8D1 HS]|uniref:APC family permease n=1 Tax=Siminovitchia sp. 179-K 8D1 HS TaxID=3142385 RepID=UPI00399F4754
MEASRTSDAAIQKPYAATDADQLKKVFKTKDLVVFGLVFMAPVSAQTLFGELSMVSRGHAVLSYLVALVAMIFTAASYGKMANAFPAAGSTYSYTAKAIHPAVGFIAGWTILLDYLMMPILLTKLSALFSLELLPNVPYWIMLLVFFVPITLFNYYGTVITARVNMVMTAAMLFSLVIFILFAMIHLVRAGGIGNLFEIEGIFNINTFSMDALAAGASIAVLSYLGFDAVTTMAEDSKETGKIVGRAAVIALLFASFFYILQVYFATLVAPDFNAFSSQDTAFFEIATKVGGGALATVCTVIIAITGIATGLAGQSSGSRILYGMGRDRVLPAIFARLHPKHKSPYASIMILAVTGYCGALLLPLSLIFSIMVFGALIGFTCVNISVFVAFFMKKKQRSGKYLLLHLLFPLLGVFVCLNILFGMDAIGITVGFSWMMTGAIVLLLRMRAVKKSGGKDPFKLDM